MQPKFTYQNVCEHWKHPWRIQSRRRRWGNKRNHHRGSNWADWKKDQSQLRTSQNAQTQTLTQSLPRRRVAVLIVRKLSTRSVEKPGLLEPCQKQHWRYGTFPHTNIAHFMKKAREYYKNLFSPGVTGRQKWTLGNWVHQLIGFLTFQETISDGQFATSDKSPTGA